MPQGTFTKLIALILLVIVIMAGCNKNTKPQIQTNAKVVYYSNLEEYLAFRNMTVHSSYWIDPNAYKKYFKLVINWQIIGEAKLDNPYIIIIPKEDAVWSSISAKSGTNVFIGKDLSFESPLKRAGKQIPFSLEELEVKKVIHPLDAEVNNIELEFFINDETKTRNYDIIMLFELPSGLVVKTLQTY